jgi:hypothetical protein
MSKRSKQQHSANQPQPANPQPGSATIHAPVKQPTLLAVSIVLFGLWFVFLLVTALFG